LTLVLIIYNIQKRQISNIDIYNKTCQSRSIDYGSNIY